MSSSEQLEAFLRAAREATGESIEAFSVFAFGDSAEMADALAALVLAGRKCATAGLLESYEMDSEPLPRTGNLSVICGGEGRAVALIRTGAVTLTPFAEVDAAFAQAEGEGDGSLAYWRAAHQDYFGRSGLTFSETSPVVCERFELIYPPSPA